jgi:hypothetical protein
MPLYRAAPQFNDSDPDPDDEFDQSAFSRADAMTLVQTAIMAGASFAPKGSVCIGEVLEGEEIDWFGAWDWDRQGWRWDDQD